MGLRLRTTPSGSGTVLPGGVLGRYGGRTRGPFAAFVGSPSVDAGNGVTQQAYPNPGPHVEAAARSVMGRAVGSIVAATQDGARLIVRGVDGVWYITDNQGVPLQATTVQIATQLVQQGQFVRWNGTVMPDGNIVWANMSPGDAAAMAGAMGAPERAAAATTTQAGTAAGADTTTTPSASGIAGGAGIPAGMKFVGIAQDGKTLIFTDASGVTHAFTRDPVTMQLTPVASNPKPAATTTAPTTTPTAAAPKPTAPTTLPNTSTAGETLPADVVDQGPPEETPVGGSGTFVAPPPPGPISYPGEPVGGPDPFTSEDPSRTIPELPGSPTGGEDLTPTGQPTINAPVPQTLMDVLNAAPDDFNLTPEQIAALTATMVDSSMFDPGYTEPTPPPPSGGGGGGGRRL